MSNTLLESLIVGEMKISACESAEATEFQHSPILRFLALMADFEGKPHEALTLVGTDSPTLSKRVLRCSLA
jgi:hypothetical protein